MTLSHETLDLLLLGLIALALVMAQVQPVLTPPYGRHTRAR